MEKRVTASGLTRREFMQASLAGCTLLALSPAVIPAEVSAQTKGPFDLPPLPYAEDALAPVISAGTIGFHYGKHHRGYLDNLNGLVRGTPYERVRLEEVIRASASSPGQATVFNNAAQVWNHTFYWDGMKAGGAANRRAKSAGGSTGISAATKISGRNSSRRPWGSLEADGRGSLRTAGR